MTIFPEFIISVALLSRQGLTAQVGLPLPFAFHNKGIGYHFVYARYPHSRDPVIHGGRKRGPVYCTDVRKHIDAMLVLDMLHCIGPRESAPHSQFHIFTGVEARSAAAAERLL